MGRIYLLGPNTVVCVQFPLKGLFYGSNEVTSRPASHKNASLTLQNARLALQNATRAIKT